MLSSSLERTLQAALALASAQRHEYATLEHLLLALLDDADAQMALRACHTDLAELRTGLTGFIEDDLTGLVTTREGEPKPTAGFQRVVQRAAIRVQAAGQDEVTGAHVLLALFSERESHAVYFLQQQGVTKSGLTGVMGAGMRGPGRIFVALTAGPETAKAWMQGYLPAIRAAGHQAEPPLPIGLAEGVTEAVLSQIRKSRLLVADYTRADGAVPFVSGFALGLGIPVVSTCRVDQAADLRASDRRGQDMLRWERPEDLAAGLAARIVDALGRSPTEAGPAPDVAADGGLLDATSTALQSLIARGRQRGYVTTDELNAAMPEGQMSAGFIEDLLAWLSENGIDVVDNEKGPATPGTP
jgi:hypothetical protein